MIAMGQELMQPPNVKGWDGGQAWINSATLFNRYNTATGLIFGVGAPPRGRDSGRSGSASSESEQNLWMNDGAADSRREGDRRPPCRT